MKEDHVYRIKAKSRFDIECNKWNVPPFIFKAEEVNFPKLKANRIKELIENEKESKTLEVGEIEKRGQSNARLTGNFKSVKGIYIDFIMNLKISFSRAKIKQPK